MEIDKTEQYLFATATQMGWGKEEVVEVFKAHEKFTRKEIMEQFDMDFWSSNKQKENALNRMYKHVVDNPDIYNSLISQDEIKHITENTKKRSALGLGTQDRSLPSVRANVARPVSDLTAKVDRITGKLSNILDMKLDTINSKAELKKVSLVQLTTALGTMIDKGRLMKGEATEHVAHIVTDKGIDKMNKDELLDALADQRTKDLEAK